jgi:hypothetical protein
MVIAMGRKPRPAALSRVLRSLLAVSALLAGACTGPVTPTASPGTEVVVFIDFSASVRPADKALFKQDLMNVIIPSLAEGDRLIIAAISDRTFTDFHPIVEATFPSKPQFNGWLDNTLKHNEQVKHVSAEVTRIRETIRTQVNDMFNRHWGSPQTDIFSSMVIAQKLFDNEPRKKVLVLMSDMIQDYAPYRFETVKWSKDTNSQIIGDLTNRGFVPDLTGVCVYVTGISAHSADMAERISDFWQTYFQQTHADSSPSRYAHVLLHWPPSRSCRV